MPNGGQNCPLKPKYVFSLYANANACLGLTTRTRSPSLNNLAKLYRAKGQYANAEPFYQRKLAITEKAFGPEHPDVAT